MDSLGVYSLDYFVLALFLNGCFPPGVTLGLSGNSRIQWKRASQWEEVSRAELVSTSSPDTSEEVFDR
jgi:hypothetical protein